MLLLASGCASRASRDGCPANASPAPVAAGADAPQADGRVLGADGRARQRHRVHRPAVPLLRTLRTRYVAAHPQGVRRYRQGAVCDARPAVAFPRFRRTCGRRGALRRRAGQVLGIPRGAVRRAVAPGVGTVRAASRRSWVSTPPVSRRAGPIPATLEAVRRGCGTRCGERHLGHAQFRDRPRRRRRVHRRSGVRRRVVRALRGAARRPC